MSYVEMFPELQSERVYQIASGIEDDGILLKLLQDLNNENKARRVLEGRCRLLKDDNDRFNMFYIRGKYNGQTAMPAVADEFTAFSVGRRAIPLLFDLYCASPKQLATFIWNFNIDFNLQFRQQREELLSTFGRCPGFIQAMSDIWHNVERGAGCSGAVADYTLAIIF